MIMSVTQMPVNPNDDSHGDPAQTADQNAASGSSRLGLPDAMATTRSVVLMPDKGLTKLMPVIEVLVQEGLDVLSVEVGGDSDLAALTSIYSFRATLGVHGVHTAAHARAAANARASFAFCVDPEPQALEVLAETGVPAIVEALTPTEVRHAWDLGVAGVHINPADVFPRRYAKALRTMVPDATLIASSFENKEGQAWVNEGATAVSLSDGLLARVFISDDFTSLRNRAADAAKIFRRKR